MLTAGLTAVQKQAMLDAARKHLLRILGPNCVGLLVPGIGAQGGELETALKAGLRKDGKGMLIPVSRGISRAEKPSLAAAEIRDQILDIKRHLNR